MGVKLVVCKKRRVIIFGKTVFKNKKPGRSGYEPYITTSRFNSIGTTTVVTDWKTGRGIHCLSQGEALWYYILRWDDKNVDIQEQFPLDMDVIEDIFEEYGIPKIRDDKFIMSTDFLVTRKGGSRIAYSVKDSRQLDERTLQLLYVEKKYWMTQKVEWQLMFKEDVNKVLANNIRLLAEFYNPESVVNNISNSIIKTDCSRRVTFTSNKC